MAQVTDWDMPAQAFTADDLAEIGAAVLRGVGAMSAFGWSAPDGVLEYAERPADWRQALVYDLMCASRAGIQGQPARDRLHKFAVEDTNALDRIAAAIV